MTLIRDFVPPIVLSAARRLLGRPTEEEAAQARRYASYAEALADSITDGYQNAEIVNVVLEKTKRYRDRVAQGIEPLDVTAANAFSLSSLLGSLDSKEINVLDFGGACGVHYFLARAALPASCRLNWIVVETPGMAQRAAAALATDELRFSSSLSDAAASMKRVDVLHTAGTIQYIDTPYDCLRTLMSVSADRMLIGRLALAQGDHDVFTVQKSMLSVNGPGPMPAGIPDRTVRYPLVFPQESKFRRILGERYDTLMTFDDPSGVLPVEGEQLVGLGLLTRRRAGPVLQ